MGSSAVARTNRTAAARRGLALYLGLVTLGTLVLQWAILSRGASTAEQGGLVALLMWLPALASFVARLVLREGRGDICLRLGGRRGLKPAMVGWLFPLAVGLLAYGLAWLSGLVPLTLPQQGYFQTADSPVVRLALNVVLGLSVLTLAGTLTAAGEEIGWRGYMLTRLIDSGAPRPVLLSGLIWSAWHLPLVVSGLYTAGTDPLLSACFFTVSVTAFSYLLAALRLRSGSVWPAIVAHGAWNALIRATFDPFAATPGSGLWIGETGILVALATVVLAALLTRGVWEMRRAPDETAFAVAKARDL
jgi:uncharacterized protein